MGLPREVTDRKGLATRYTFDEKDRPLTTTYADGSSLRQRYDAVGRLVTLERSAGGIGSGLSETFSYRYDHTA